VSEFLLHCECQLPRSVPGRRLHMFFVQVIYITLATIGTYLSACERIGDFATGIVAQYNPRCLARFSIFLLDLPQGVFQRSLLCHRDGILAQHVAKVDEIWYYFLTPELAQSLGSMVSVVWGDKDVESILPSSIGNIRNLASDSSRSS